MKGLTLDWLEREPPLEAAAVLALGQAATRLARKLLGRADDGDGQFDGQFEGILGAVGEGSLLLIGPGLPWTEGVVYLGADPQAPALLLPTTRRPSLPVQLLERALLQLPGLAPPIAVLPEPPLLFSGGLARPVARKRLAEWLAHG